MIKNQKKIIKKPKPPTKNKTNLQCIIRIKFNNPKKDYKT